MPTVEEEKIRLMQEAIDKFKKALFKTSQSKFVMRILDKTLDGIDKVLTRIENFLFKIGA